MSSSRHFPVGAWDRHTRRRLVETAVQSVTNGYTELGIPRDSVLLAMGRNTVVAAQLAEHDLRVHSFVVPDVSARSYFGEGDSDATRQFASGCVLDDMLGFVDDPSALLKAAYSHLEPGGLLVATLGNPRRMDQSASEPAVTATPDTRPLLRGQGLQSLLFREGFVSPRYKKCSGGTLVITAQRGSLTPPSSRDHRLSVIVPVYNEAETFPKMMEELLAKEIPGVVIDVVIVESNSTDGTRELAIGYANHPRVDLILEERARGKGHAVRTGLANAEGDFVLIQDADLEYDIDDYGALLAPLRSFTTGFVLGVRTPTQGAMWGVRRFASEAITSSFMNIGNSIFRALFNIVYRQQLRDPFTMAKVFRRDCVHGMKLECNRFDFDWELLAKLVRAGYAPVEVPIAYRSRSFAEGKKIRAFRDSLTWIVACFKYRFARLEP